MADNGLPCDNCPHEMECKADDECRLTQEQLDYYNKPIACADCAHFGKVEQGIWNRLDISLNPLQTTTMGCTLPPYKCTFKRKTDGPN